ncbi:MAG: hypothetical protein M3R17_09905 [Bacteroidota bacterium]|nr:hypothetical protein [Bacteroidota bacterium]
MTLKTIKTVCLLSVMTMGLMHSALPAMTTDYASVHIQKTEKEWTLLQTKDGVTCYYKVDNLGTGKGVFLRFVNDSGTEVKVTWDVTYGKAVAGGDLTIASGKSADSISQPEGSKPLVVRIDSETPFISYTVSK